MRSLRDFKIPDFKFPKISFKNFTKIEEITEEAKAKEAQKGLKKKEPIPEPIKYDTFQDVFKDVTEKFKDNPLIVQKDILCTSLLSPRLGWVYNLRFKEKMQWHVSSSFYQIGEYERTCRE